MSKLTDEGVLSKLCGGYLLDSRRLKFLIDEQCVVATTKIWEVDHYRLEWPFEGYYQREWYKTAKEAIDAQMEE